MHYLKIRCHDHITVCFSWEKVGSHILRALFQKSSLKLYHFIQPKFTHLLLQLWTRFPLHITASQVFPSEMVPREAQPSASAKVAKGQGWKGASNHPHTSHGSHCKIST